MSSQNEILTVLFREAKRPSRNAATLTHNLRTTFPYLETQWDDKAKRIIGALVAVNASRMHTTIWAALFQQLRDSESSTVKVYVLKQFANVCWTVPLTQGGNAFRTFAIEIAPLLSDIQILTNITFQKTFASIIRILKIFADDKLSNELYDILYSNLRTWKRPEGIRAAALAIKELVMHIQHCPTVDELTSQAKSEVDLVAYAVLIDTLVYGESEDCHVQSENRITSLCNSTDGLLATVANSTTENAKAIPPCVNAYKRLRALRSSWSPESANTFARIVVDALQTGKASKLLLCPFLQFLQAATPCWWNHASVVWKLTEDADPFVRADAILALANGSELLAAREKCLTVFKLMDKLRHYIDEKCSYSIIATLKFLKLLIFSTTLPRSTQQLYISKLLHICERHGKTFVDDTSAQIELLNFLEAASVASQPATTCVLDLFMNSSDRNVASRAFAVLTHLTLSPNSTNMNSISVNAAIDNSFRGYDNYFEGVAAFLHLETSTRTTTSPVRFYPSRVEQLNAVIQSRFSRLAARETDKWWPNSLVACDAARQLCKIVAKQSSCLHVSQHPTLNSVAHLLLSQSGFSSDVYASLLKAASACVAVDNSGISTDVHLLMRLVQHSWTVLLDCAASVYPDFSPCVEPCSYRFFRSNATTWQLRDLISKCKDLALANDVPFDESVFFEIIDGATQLLKSCIAALKNCPVFQVELADAVDYILYCCDALFFFTPKQTMRLLTTVLCTVAAEEDKNTSDQLQQTTILLHFCRGCSSVINRAFTVNFAMYCPELCNFLIVCAQRDMAETDTAFSEAVGNSWSNIAEMTAFCARDSVCYSSTNEGKAVYAILRLLRCLYFGIYRTVVKEVVSRKVVDQLAHVSRQWSWFAEKVDCCTIIAQLARCYEETDIVASALSRFDAKSGIPYDIFELMDTLADLWNASDADAQLSIRDYLLQKRMCEHMICLAGLDETYIPASVQAALTFPTKAESLELLALIIKEATIQHLPPLEFFVEDAVIGNFDGSVKQVIQSYRWGWIYGEKARDTLSRKPWETRDTVLCAYLKQQQHLPLKPEKGSFSNDVENTSNATENGDGDAAAKTSFFARATLGVSAISFIGPGGDAAPLHKCASEILQSNDASALKVLKLSLDERSDMAQLAHPHIIVYFADFLSRCSYHVMASWDLVDWMLLLRRWVDVTLAAPLQSEQREWLQLGCWTLFQRLQVHFYMVNQKLATTANGKEVVDRVVNEFRMIYLELANCFFGCRAKSGGEVALHLFQYAIRNELIFDAGDVCEEIFWCIARFCLDGLWNLIAREQVASLHDPEVVRFLCRAHCKIQLTVHIQREVHATFSPLLLSPAGTADQNVEPQTRRHIAWLIGSFASSASLLGVESKNFEGQSTSHPSGNEAGSEVAHMPQPPRNRASSQAMVLCAEIQSTLLQMTERVLAKPLSASINDVLDAFDNLCAVQCAIAASAFPPSTELSPVIDQAYLVTKRFLEGIPPLAPDAPLEPTGHCLARLLETFPAPRRPSTFCDEHVLVAATCVLSAMLSTCLRCSSAGAPPPPAQVPCMLALYMPYLVRIDLPLYATALTCLSTILRDGASAEAGAVLKIVLPRLAEDMVDIQWDAVVAACWYKSLMATLALVATAIAETEKDLFSRRLWEGVWRGVGTSILRPSEEMNLCGHLILRHVIGELTPKSPQWDLVRLVLLGSETQSPAVGTSSFVCGAADAFDARVPLFVARDVMESKRRITLVETQADFASHKATALDDDDAHSLLFEFGKQVTPPRDTVDETLTCDDETCYCSLLMERVCGSLVSSTENLLAALNHFTFSAVGRRRTVLHNLAHIIVNESQARPAVDMMRARWASMCFEILYDRATCADEGLWVACVLAVVESSRLDPAWGVAALGSLVSATSTSWKRDFLRRVDDMAKRGGTQGGVRDFFATASDRLSSLRVMPPLWKTELLVEVTFMFSA